MEMCSRNHMLWTDEDWYYFPAEEGQPVRRSCRRCRTEYQREYRGRRKEGTPKKGGPPTHCPRGHEFTIESSYWTTNVEGYRYRKCRVCKAELAKARRDADLDRAREREQARRDRGGAQKTPDQRRQDNDRRRQRQTEIRDAVQEHYGGVCAECGAGGVLGFELQLDHVNDDGAEHRRWLIEEQGLKTPSGRPFYAWLYRSGFPKKPELQLLCQSCHHNKTYPNRLDESKTASNRQRRDLLRTQVAHAYGDENGGCVVCHREGRLGFELRLDHVNNDAEEHRASLRVGRADERLTGWKFYALLRREGFPNDPPLQVLCKTCQEAKYSC